MNENLTTTIEGIAAAIFVGITYLVAIVVGLALMALPVVALLKLLGIL